MPSATASTPSTASGSPPTGPRHSANQAPTPSATTTRRRSRLHSGHGPHEEMDERAIACFDQALEDAGLTDEPLRQVLHDYFAWATTTTMSAYHHTAGDVPPELTIPRWSRNGRA